MSESPVQPEKCALSARQSSEAFGLQGKLHGYERNRLIAWPVCGTLFG